MAIRASARNTNATATASGSGRRRVAVDPQVPPRREQVGRHGERQQDQQPRRAFGLDRRDRAARTRPTEAVAHTINTTTRPTRIGACSPRSVVSVRSSISIAESAANPAARMRPAGVASTNPPFGPSSTHAGRGERVQRQEPRAREQHHRDQEEPFVAAPSRDLAHDQAEGHVDAGRRRTRARSAMDGAPNARRATGTPASRPVPRAGRSMRPRGTRVRAPRCGTRVPSSHHAASCRRVHRPSGRRDRTRSWARLRPGGLASYLLVSRLRPRWRSDVNRS